MNTFIIIRVCYGEDIGCVYPPKLWELSMRLLGLSESKSAEFIPSGSKCAILCPLS